MNISIEEKREIANRSHKPLLYLGIIAICMFFGGLTSGYMVRSGDPGWVRFDLPSQFFTSTAFILLSSLTMWLALWAAKKDNLGMVKAGMALTLLLGIGFIVSQVQAWGQLNQSGIFFGGSASHPAGSFLFALVFIGHLGHLFGGIIMLIYVCIKSFKELYNSKNLLGLQLCSIYWHFLDLLWIYLLVFIYFNH